MSLIYLPRLGAPYAHRPTAERLGLTAGKPLIRLREVALLLTFMPSILFAQPISRMSVKLEGSYQQWWRSDKAPIRWTDGDPVVRKAMRWRTARLGMDWTELHLSGRAEALRLRIILVRIEPVRFRFSLESAGTVTQPKWSVDSASSSGALAFNAGQFGDAGPWGWLVHQGRELQQPGIGPLSGAVALDSTGSFIWIEYDSIPLIRSRGKLVEALQSYPVLLTGDGAIPLRLRHGGLGVDLLHRDSRLAIGELRDGRLLVALTRVDLVPSPLDATPFGLTVPEMAALMGAMGCRRGMLLDGGISGQLLFRDYLGRTHAWRGWRDVPVGLVVTPR